MVETLRDGRFVVKAPLGQGTQGQTFDGTDLRTGQAVAIKRFDVRGAQSWKDVELAEREARVLQSLSHPKLPGYIDHFESDGVLYLVMEKIEGQNLASWKARGVVLGEQEIVRFLTDASEVLDYLGSRAPPVIHRDLKPGNVIRRPDGSFAFVDFGAVRDKLRPRGGSTVVGTFGYMAPEQFQGRALASSDVYAIGATAVAMLTGREPEDLPHRGLALDVHMALQGVASAPLRSVLERMLTPDPEDRPGRIAPLLDEISSRRSPEWTRVNAWAEDDVWNFVHNRHWQKLVRAEARRAESRARRHARMMMRQAMSAHRSHVHAIPPPIMFLLALGFAVAAIAVTLATQLIVPMVLRVLALFIAPRALKSAATQVRLAGREALASMAQGQRALSSSSRPDDLIGPTRIDTEGTRVRVSDTSRVEHGRDAAVVDGQRSTDDDVPSNSASTRR